MQALQLLLINRFFSSIVGKEVRYLCIGSTYGERNNRFNVFLEILCTKQAGTESKCDEKNVEHAFILVPGWCQCIKRSHASVEGCVGEYWIIPEALFRSLDQFLSILLYVWGQ